MSSDSSLSSEQLVTLLNIGLESDAPPERTGETLLMPDEGPVPSTGAGTVVGPGLTIGRYRLVEVIGEGGFGMVWRAEQTGSLRREVALKLIKPGMDSREIIARFESERSALSLMDHPNIAAVLDAGTTDAGQPYFVMELVRGRPVTTYCDENRLTVRQRLELFLPICHAVQHAHQKAILHRDLKPSNILVVEVDGRPVPKVIDFGIAKALAPSPEDVLEASLARTMESMIIGTPQYMSPEQAGSVPDVDTRSDIFTLGIVLHELLTGSPPLTRASVRGIALENVLAGIRDHDITAPSSRLLVASEETSAVAEARKMDSISLRRELQGELDWVVLKAVEKDREHRYQAVADLALDVQRYLRHEPVSAGQPRRVYLIKRFVRRHRGAAIGATVFFLSLLAGATTVTWLYLTEKRALEKVLAAQSRTAVAEAAASAEAARSEGIADFLLTTLKEINPKVAQGRDVTVLRDVMLGIDQRRAKRFAKDPGVSARLAFALALGLREMVSPRETLAAYSEAFRLFTEAGLGDSLDAAKCLNGMATSLKKYSTRPGFDGKREEALTQSVDWNRRCLEIRQRLLPPDDSDTIRSIMDYGEILMLTGQEEQGLKLLEEGLGLARKKGDQSSFARALELQAEAAQLRGDFTHAEALAKEAIGIRQSQGRPSQSQYQLLANSWHRLYLIYKAQKNLTAAEEAVAYMLEYRKKELGYEPSGTLANMGGILALEGENERAKSWFLRALESAALHERRPYPSDVIDRFVHLELTTNDRAGAEKLLRDVVAALRKSPDADPTDLKFATDRLAALGVELP